MQIDFITRADLLEFRNQLLTELKAIIISNEKPEPGQYLKSGQVRKILNISAGTLQNLRITGKLHPTKIAGTLYYSLDEIQSLLSGK
ncbi:MAG: helix-turn-helix domain-containing protein [Bacteroidota bacterium]|nr:helix-turn-helix domain-containing protein [Bacteroidota bacterium]